MPGLSSHANLRPTTPAASVFLPKEHGSWSLAIEPLALGLLVAPSHVVRAVEDLALLITQASALKA